MAVIKLRNVNTYEPPRLAHFDGPPNWQCLSLKIAEIFDIPQQEVGVAYVDKDQEPITLRNDQDLLHFYETIGSFGDTRLVVQDLRTHEGEPDGSISNLGTYSLISVSQTLNHRFR